MLNQFLLLAQIADEDIEITAGRVIAGLMVMAALAGSAGMMIFWALRVRSTGHVFPAARRKPICVPVLLLVLGVLMSASMALMVATVDDGDIRAAAQSAQSAETAAEAEQDESITQTDAQEGSADAADRSDTNDDTAADETAVAESPATSDDEAVVQPDSDKDDPSAEAESDVANAAAGPTAAKKAPPLTEAQFFQMILGTMLINGAIFGVFGVTILIVQQFQNRTMRHSEDLGYPPPGALVAAEGVSPAAAADAPVASDFAPQPGSMVASSDDPNPYAAPDPDSTPVVEGPLPLETWNFATELRFAGETFLAAYLPTAALRILILWLQPEAPSHPFLEMIEQGVSPSTMLLIAVMAVLVAPIVEELLYRVTILGGMMQVKSGRAGLILSSILFAFAHGFPDSIALLPLAFAIGYTYMRRRSYRTVILVHFLFNGFNMLVAGFGMM